MSDSDQRPRVLVVDDKVEMAETIADALEEQGFRATATGSARKALTMLAETEAAARVDVLVTDLRMPDVDGLSLLAASREVDPERPVLIMTGYGAVDSAVESIRRGAFHYLTKPFKTEELVLFLRRAVEQVALRRETVALRRAVAQRRPHPTILGRSRAIRDLVENVERLSDVATPVLLLGETGTGKSLVARALHDASSRRDQPFITVNCAAIPGELLESELFGHVKGAFTGAVGNKTGLFVEAGAGTLFLDEVGELPLPLQAKLLDVLGRKTVRPVGGTKERAIDARIVAATHRNLREASRQGTFREDLFFRLSVVTLDVPPLRARPEDLPFFIEHFFERFRLEHPKSPAERVGRDAMARLLAYAWPGNVRELSHVMERAVLLARGPEIGLADLPDDVVRGVRQGDVSFGGAVLPLREISRRYASWAFHELASHRSRTAAALEVDPKTLDKLLGEADDEAG